MKRFFLIASCLCLLAGCSGSPPASSISPQPDTTVQNPTVSSELNISGAQSETLCLAYDPTDSFNPYLATSRVNCKLGLLMYEGLFTLTDNGEAEPRLCTHYDVSADGMSYTFYLRKDVHMHNGDTLDVDDIIASFHTARQSDRYRYRLRHISSIVSVEPDTITVLLDTPYENLPLLLDIPILPADEQDAPLPSGTGPYHMIAHTLYAHQNWWCGEAPYGTTVNCYAASTATLLADSFTSGAVNLVCVDPNGASEPVYHSNDALYSTRTSTLQYLGFRMDDGPFSNAVLRAALTYLIDRDTLVADTCGGFATATCLPTHPESSASDRSLAASFSYRPEAFLQAMEQAGIRDITGDGILDLPTDAGTIPAQGTLLVCSACTQRVAAANALAETLSSYGIDLTVQALSYNAYVRALKNGSYDLYYGEITLSPDGDLSVFFDAQSEVSIGGLADGVMLQLCLSALENVGNYYTLCKTIMEDGLFLPVLYKQEAVYVRQELHLELTPAPGNPFYHHLEE